MSCHERFGPSIGYSLALTIALTLSGCSVVNIRGVSLLPATGGPCTQCDLPVADGHVCPPKGWCNGYTTWRPLVTECDQAECIEITEEVTEPAEVDTSQPDSQQPTEAPAVFLETADWVDSGPEVGDGSTSGLVQPATLVFPVPERVRIMGGRGG